jgi:gamma-glutamylcyclotransferase (GGCT)/AIG2-like uncharacterized protein YtfP
MSDTSNNTVMHLSAAARRAPALPASFLPKRIFVYGTLRRDMYPERAKQGGEVLGMGTIPGSLYRLGWFPGLVPSTDPAHRVVGQVIDYEKIHDGAWISTVNGLDRYEGVASGLYRREVVKVTMEDGNVVEAHAYFYGHPTDVSPDKLIPSGDWAKA